MTVFLRAVYGPFGPFEEHVGTGAHIVDWHFFGIREDDAMGRWAVRFTARERRWKTVNFPIQSKPPLPELCRAFVPDRPMVHGGTYLDILKRRLRKSDIAFATRAAIEAAR